MATIFSLLFYYIELENRLKRLTMTPVSLESRTYLKINSQGAEAAARAERASAQVSPLRHWTPASRPSDILSDNFILGFPLWADIKTTHAERMTSRFWNAETDLLYCCDILFFSDQKCCCCSVESRRMRKIFAILCGFWFEKPWAEKESRRIASFNLILLHVRRCLALCVPTRSTN